MTKKSKKPTGRHLAQLASDANRFLDEATRLQEVVRKSTKRRLECAKRSGEALLAAQKLVKYGEWEDWASKNFNGSRPLRQNWMKIAAEWDKIEPVVKELELKQKTLSINGALRLIRNPSPDKAGRGEMKHIYRVIRELSPEAISLISLQPHRFKEMIDAFVRKELPKLTQQEKDFGKAMKGIAGRIGA